MQSYWLLKTEPEEYSWQDILRDKRTVWDGVKSNPALKILAQMKSDDLAFIYHTGKERAIMGVARVAGEPYPDPGRANPRLLVVEVIAQESLPQPVTLARIKKSKLFPDWELVRQPRLSVVPVSEKQWKTILEMAFL